MLLQGACPEVDGAGTSRLVWKLQWPGRATVHDRRSRGTGIQEARLARFILRLYVTGSSPRSETAVANLRRICEEELRGEYALDVIDVLEHPEAAERDRVLATPTLIKQLPPPLRRVIGDLSDKDKVLLGLEVRPPTTTPSNS